jgi:very-short-patch-repair endonuclease
MNLPNDNPIKVELAYLPVINFSMQQNRVSVIRPFSIENLTDNDLNNVHITIVSEPEFAQATTQLVATIPAKTAINVERLPLTLSTSYFAQLTERLSGNLTLEIASDDNVLFKQLYPVDILAFDQWSGVTILPEMLSAFATPNHPALAPILKRASSILEQWTGSSALDEYQSRNPNRVRQQMAAVYTAIAEQNIVYSTIPASFEDYGQRIRLSDAVLAQKMGTCLDMALLYASCLEAIGIHPLIIVIWGHAFAGGWLIPDTFPDNITDDISFITKRIADGISEITLVETTCMNQGKNADFEQAVKAAKFNLANESAFILALDIKRSRFAGIKPLPQRILNGEQWEVKEDDIPETDKSKVTLENINPYDLSSIDSNVTVTKQLLWERKLLDLSLRNNLLNIRITKNTLQLISANLDIFEDALAAGEEFRIMPRPSDWENPLYDFGLYHLTGNTDPVVELIKSEITQKRLRSYLPEAELSRALTHLYRSSKLSMEENGANTLYIALGLLKWFEAPASERPRYAPLLLLPVEIIRKSAAQGYIIRSRDEDTMMNITLLEMLRQNFGITITGLDPLPTDHSGVDVKLIYTIIRHAIKNQPKWDVEEQAILGIFSFNKFIMWNDIHNNSSKLLDNKLVSSLANGKIEWEVQESAADAAALDRELTPADILLPIGADSSQLESIYEAINDKSYILHGPPGTGKSQTITNIIANALYRGKRVLFVAEKMAALSVVQNRLKNIGLAPFCLELHSNKTQKSLILAQLKEATEAVRHKSPETFQQEATRLHGFRSELNGYLNALHKKHPFGFSLYDAITRYLSLEADHEVSFPVNLLSSLSPEKLIEWQDGLDKLVNVGKVCGHPHNHPLRSIYITEYSSALKENAAKIIQELLLLLSDIRAKITEIVRFLCLSDELLQSRQQLNIVTDLLSRLLNIPELTPELLTQNRLNETLDEVRQAIPHGKERDDARQKVLQIFDDSILQLPAKPLLSEWTACENKWFIPQYFGHKKIRKQLRAYRLSASHKFDAKNYLIQLTRYQEEEKIVARCTSVPALFGRFGKRAQEDWAAIEQTVDDCVAINSLSLKLTNDINQSATLKTGLAKHFTEGVYSFKALHGNKLSAFINSITQLSGLEKDLETTLGITVNNLYSGNYIWVNNALENLQTWQANLDKLKDWYQWLYVCKYFDTMQLNFVPATYQQKNIPTEQLQNAFYKGLYHAAIQKIISEDPVLELFKGKLFNEVIEKYKALTANFQDLAKRELYAKLAVNIPSFVVEAAQSSEVGILQRNIKNNARGISIRKLFDQIPTLLSRLCPCMLMSPISVAQYIDPDADKFDLIVFDEASQMPTYEAIGAIARGKNIVIVGDPKQMPPTSFFSTNTTDEENIEMEDLESILDDCLALSMPSKYLLWHYRSKHESLIAFSNSQYYGNKLFTFPSPDNIESKVRFAPVSGFYDKGKTRQNKAEAQAIIDEISRRLSDEKLRKRSIGVVTFSSVQQTLIDDMLSALFVKNSELEKLACEREEPLFVKNLENVQGDERDIILFSVGYGPDAEGKVSMNFGPLNRLGGERRLNVAVSRARYEMIIFSSLQPDMIDLNRTSAVGVAGLKSFLEYARNGEKVAISQESGSPNASAIEDIIAKALRKQGHEVHTHIGCSGYRVDMGVVDKRNPARYILGILCDGENYRQAKTARDREVVQNNALRLLGWNICRIWTMDWWENPQEVLNTIAEAIKNAEENKQPLAAEKTPLPLTETLADSIAENPPQEMAENSPKYVKPYQQALLLPVSYPAEAFFSPEYKHIILGQIKEVVEAEAPISRSLLCKKVLSAWGITRMGQRLDTYFTTLFSHLPYYQTADDKGNTFSWQDKEQHDTYDIYRISSNRDALDIPPAEVANAMKQILREQISLPTPDLSRLAAQLLGFARMGTNVETAMHSGLKEAVVKGLFKVETGRAITL